MGFRSLLLFATGTAWVAVLSLDGIAAPPESSTAPNPTAPPTNVRRHVADDPKALSNAAASLKLWEPPALQGGQALSAAAANLALWQPKTPSDLVGGFEGADPLLVKWMRAWEVRLAAGIADQASDLDELHRAISNSRLTPESCILAVRILSGWEDSVTDRTLAYHSVSSAFACSAIWTVSQQIRKAPETVAERSALVAPLIRRLWWGIQPDMKSPQPDLQAVKEFYTLLWQFNPEGSADQHRGEDGRIEAMICLHDFAGAAEEANDALTKTPNLSANEKADFAYLHGWSLYYLGRYSEAIPRLRVAVDRDNCEKCDRAFRLLALSQARLNKTDAMHKTVKIWVDRFHPTPQEAAPLFSMLDELAMDRVASARDLGNGGER